MQRDAPTESTPAQVDPDFQRWMGQLQERNFFTGNAIVTLAMATLGGSVPVMVNFLQQRPAYRRMS